VIKARTVTGSFNEAASPASCRYILLVQIEIGRSDANYYNPSLLCRTATTMAVRPGGVFRSACIAKYVISGPRRSPIYDVEFLSRAIVLGCARTRTHRYIDACPTSRRTLGRRQKEKRIRNHPRRCSHTKIPSAQLMRERYARRDARPIEKIRESDGGKESKKFLLSKR